MTWHIFCKLWHRWREELKSGRKKRGKNMPRNLLHNLLGNLLNTWPVLTVFIGPILGTKEIRTEEPSPAQATAALQSAADSGALGTQRGGTPARDPQLHPLLLICSQGVRGNKRRAFVKELRFCWPCPSNHRGEGLLLNHRSSGIWVWAAWTFCWACFCCLGFQHAGLLATSPALGFHLVQLHSLSFCQVGLLLCLASASQGSSPCCFSEVKYKKWYQRCWGGCAISLVLSRHSKNLKRWTDQCYGSV